jgi:hypothetical protein
MATSSPHALDGPRRPTHKSTSILGSRFSLLRPQIESNKPLLAHKRVFRVPISLILCNRLELLIPLQ